jgi:two-component sensor histidine kinase
MVLVVGTILPLAILSVVTINANYRSEKAAASARILQTTRGVMASVDRQLQYQRAGLEVLALSPDLRHGDLEAFREEAMRFAKRFAVASAVGVSDARGQQLLNTNVPKGGQLHPRADLTVINEVFETGKPVVSDMHISRITGAPIFTIDVPVIQDGKVIYDLAFSPPRSDLSDYLNELDLPQSWVISIFDRRAQHVARRPVLKEPGITKAAPSMEAAMANRSEGIERTTTLEGVQVISAFVRSPETGWAVAIGMPTEAINAPARRAFLLAVSSSIVFLILGLVMALWLAKQIERTEETRELLVNELNHRVKNTLSAVQAIVNRTLRTATSPDAGRAAIDARVLALSHAHNILSDRNWERADLGAIVRAVLRPYQGAGPRAVISGPALDLEPRVAIALAMVLSELATNAAKYGALSASGGRVQVVWGVLEGHRLALTWQESDGPPVTPPANTGYGTQFVHRAITQELGGTLEISYEATGLTCLIEIPLPQ